MGVNGAGLRGRVLRLSATAALVAAVAAIGPAQGAAPAWVATTPTDPFGDRVSLSAFPDGSAFAAVGSNSIYRSSDGGLTWLKALNGPEEDAGISTLLSMSTPKVGFAYNGNVMSTTKDGAATWRTAKAPNVTKSRLETFEGLSAAEPGTAVAGKFGFEFDGTCPVPQQTTSFVRTADAGKTWAKATLGFPGFVQAVDMRDRLRGVASVYALTWSAPVRDGGACSIEATADNTAILITGDGGKTWTRRMTCPGACLAVDWTPKRLVVATSTGTVFTSVNFGRSWTRTGQIERLNGYTRVEAITFTSRKIGYAVVKNAGIYTTADGGKTWALEASPTTPAIGTYGALAQSGNRMIGATSAALLTRVAPAAAVTTTPPPAQMPQLAAASASIRIRLTTDGHDLEVIDPAGQ